MMNVSVVVVGFSYDWIVENLRRRRYETQHFKSNSDTSNKAIKMLNEFIISTQTRL